tara:strand:+ start:255 stop:557 length:303 start_codon:yes stop_codon:yes gene_type:complete
MNKFSLRLGMGLGFIFISYCYYKCCINKDLNITEIKLDDDIKLDEIKKVNESILGQDNPNIIIKDILDDIINEISKEEVDKKVKENKDKKIKYNDQWTII